MATKKKGLGKGLDALLGDAFAAAAETRKVNQADAKNFAPANLLGKKNSKVQTTKGGLSGELEKLSNIQNQQDAADAESEEAGRAPDTAIDLANGTVSATSPASPARKANTLLEIPVEVCQRGKYQPRRDIDTESLEELAASIRNQGVMQPIIIRALSDDQNNYEIIAGERRWRAAQLAGLATVPAIIKQVPDEAAMAMALVENLQRENLNPMEEAYALSRLNTEFELTHQQVADIVGKSRAAVSNSLRLMNLHKDVKVLLEHGDLEMGHARALLGLPQAVQAGVGKEVVNRSLSVRQTEALVKAHLNPAPAKATAEKNDPNINRLQDDLADKLGVPVKLQHGPKGGGKLILKYSSLDELDGILNHIQ